VKKFSWWSALVTLAAAALLSSCGGGGGSQGQVRLLNATVTHPSLDVIASSDSSKVISGVTTNTVSSFVGIASGQPSLQINDTGSSTSLVGTTFSLGSGQHVALIAYEIDGVMQVPGTIAEDAVNPAAGLSGIRVLDLAPDAGAISIYVIPNSNTSGPSAAPTATSSPTFLITTPSQTQATNFASTAPGPYSIWVTSATDPTDVRLTINSVTLADQQNAALILTPTTGGVLVNGAVLVQQGTFTSYPANGARVRVVAAVSGGATVDVTAGPTALAKAVVAPRIGSYVTIPSTATLAVKVNGTPVALSKTTVTAGTDTTLLVWGDPSAPKTTLLADDNHGSSTAGAVKVRLVNGMSGSSATPVTWSVAGAQLDTPIAVGTASTYYNSLQSTGVDFEVNSTANGSLVFSKTTDLQQNEVYTLFLFGNGSAPSTLVLDSSN